LGAGTELSYLPVFVLGVASLSLLPFFETHHAFEKKVVAAEAMFPENVVSCGLRFAMPMVFVAWAGNSLYLSLVPAYLAATLHASDPIVGAGSFVAEQAATAAASICFGAIAPERSGVVAPFFVVFGLAALVTGTHFNSWWLIGVATILVGAGGGVASGASFAITARVGRGQRARIFARLLVAAYLGYSLPALLTGVIASRSSFAIGFASVIVGLALIAAALPVLRWRSDVAMHAA
jgi:MFS family permease